MSNSPPESLIVCCIVTRSGACSIHQPSPRPGATLSRLSGYCDGHQEQVSGLTVLLIACCRMYSVAVAPWSINRIIFPEGWLAWSKLYLFSMDPGLGKCSRQPATTGVAHLGKAQAQNPLSNHLTHLVIFRPFVSKSGTLLACSPVGAVLEVRGV